MTSIANSLGVGSGVDTAVLIDSLVAAERKGADDALRLRGARNEARISGTAQVRSALTALVSALANRTRGGALGPLPVSSDPSVVAVRATAGATRALQPTSVEVRALAGGQSLVSAALATAATPVGQGTLTLTLGRLTPDGQGDFAFAGTAPGLDIAVGPGDDSLGGLAKAINAAQAAVHASLVDDGQGARLVLKGPSGAASAFILTAQGDAGLDRFIYRPGAPTLTASASARDAALTVDGVAVTRSTNSITDLIPGVRLDLGKLAVGQPVTIAASRDAPALGQAVTDLVDALNALHGVTAALVRNPGPDGGAGGALAGDPTLRTLMRQLAGLTAGNGGALAKLGVGTARDGSLTLDSAKLARAVAADPDGTESLLGGLTTRGGALAEAQATLGGGSSTVQTREQSAITAARTALDGRMAALRSQLQRQYAAMETAVSGFKSTGDFLDQQIKAWNRTN